MAQYLRPSGGFYTGGWSIVGAPAFHSCINEVVPDFDATYVTPVGLTAQYAATIGFISAPTDYPTNGNHILRFCYKSSVGTNDLAYIQMRLEWWSGFGSQYIAMAYDMTPPNDGVYHTISYSLSPAEIVDLRTNHNYATLQFQFLLLFTGSYPYPTPSPVHITWAEFEVPDGPLSSSSVSSVSSSSSSSSYIENWSSSSRTSGSTLSSSSSLTSLSSSSSSSKDYNNVDINSSQIIQGNHNLLPFSWFGEGGTTPSAVDGSELGFRVEAKDTSNLSYSSITNVSKDEN